MKYGFLSIRTGRLEYEPMEVSSRPTVNGELLATCYFDDAITADCKQPEHCLTAYATKGVVVILDELMTRDLDSPQALKTVAYDISVIADAEQLASYMERVPPGEKRMAFR